LARLIGGLASSSLLPTPVANDDGKTPEAHMAMKAGFRQPPLLPSPTASYGRRGGQYRSQNAEGGPHLEEEVAKLLPTPTSVDYKSSRKATLPGYDETSNAGTTLLDAALLSSGESTAPRSSGGKSSSAGLRLNPSFVEWMMGAPPGWSDPDCLLSATEFSSRPDG
jgi:hypothetical protein